MKESIMGKRILVGLVVLLTAASMGYAQTGELSGKVDVTYGSKYLWRGFDVFNDKSAIHPSVDLNLFDTGFGLNVVGHRANSDGHEINERWDYTLYYQGYAFGGERY